MVHPIGGPEKGDGDAAIAPTPQPGKIYLAGAISSRLERGETLEEVRAGFNAYAASLRQLGWSVVNPFDCHISPIPWEQAMRADLRAMVDCDAIFLMKNWRESRGAQLEALIAKELGMKIYTEATSEQH